MGARKLSFRLLSVLICVVSILLLVAACSPSGPTPWPTATRTPTPWPTVTPIACEWNNTDYRREQIMEEYSDLLWRQPNVYEVHAHRDFIREDNGQEIKRKGDRGRLIWARTGIAVYVYPKVDRSTLPEEDRIPVCLEGIPVQVIERSQEREELRKEDMIEYLKEKWPCAADFSVPGPQRMVVRDKYRDLLRRQPNVHGIAVGTLIHENGEAIRGAWGIKVYVTEKTDQSTLPLEDRLPDCLEGIPVQVLEEPMAILPKER